MERILGIDLGTTNSVVAYLEQGQPVVIPSAEGARTTPSVVLFKSPDEIMVGELAKRQAITYPKQTIKSVKRFMGARFSEIDILRAGINYDLVQGPEDSVLIDVGWQRFTPQQVSAEILKKLKKTAEDFFGESVSRAVITVPAYFNDNQRSATKTAGELAQLEVVRIINEPTAAALAYGIDKKVSQRLAVFDLGGGTFDLSILEVDRDVFEVRSTRGDTFLGGDTFDQTLIEHVLAGFHEETGVDLNADPQAYQRIREAAETSKCELSAAPESVLSLPFIAMGDSGPLHVQQTIKREEFEDLIKPYFQRLADCCTYAIQDAQLQPDQVGAVLLVGGSSRIPSVQRLVVDIFSKEPTRSLNPDEAVAVGAAIQGAIMTGSLREILLLDVTPLSLGVELAGGVFGTLIPRNSSIPTSHTKTFTTVKDNQSTVKVHVLQGERKIAQENHSLGVFKLTGISPAPKEIPAIDVTFHIDASGILHVQARDITSGNANALTIESYAATVPEKAADIVRDAEAAAESDREYMRRQFIKNQVANVLSELQAAEATGDSPVPTELAQQVKEAAFRVDIALSTKTIEDADSAFTILKEHAADMDGYIAMQNTRRGDNNPLLVDEDDFT